VTAGTPNLLAVTLGSRRAIGARDVTRCGHPSGTPPTLEAPHFENCPHTCGSPGLGALRKDASSRTHTARSLWLRPLRLRRSQVPLGPRPRTSHGRSPLLRWKRMGNSLSAASPRSQRAPKPPKLSVRRRVRGVHAPRPPVKNRARVALDGLSKRGLVQTPLKRRPRRLRGLRPIGAPRFELGTSSPPESCSRGTMGADGATMQGCGASSSPLRPHASRLAVDTL
jgi:hypothetical protein